MVHKTLHSLKENMGNHVQNWVFTQAQEMPNIVHHSIQEWNFLDCVYPQEGALATPLQKKTK